MINIKPFNFSEFVSIHHQAQPRTEHQIDGTTNNDMLPLTKDSGILAITKKNETSRLWLGSQG